MIDRFWFKSVYFLEPGGVLFELATDGPGFTADEELDHLGEQLVLPPWLEPHRREIEGHAARDQRAGRESESDVAAGILRRRDPFFTCAADSASAFFVAAASTAIVSVDR